MTNYTITGEMRKQKEGWADYLADGYVQRGEDMVPCEIGFVEVTYDGEPIREPFYIFIKDFISESGNHYHSERIDLF